MIKLLKKGTKSCGITNVIDSVNKEQNDENMVVVPFDLVFLVSCVLLYIGVGEPF